MLQRGLTVLQRSSKIINFIFYMYVCSFLSLQLEKLIFSGHITKNFLCTLGHEVARSLAHIKPKFLSGHTH